MKKHLVGFFCSGIILITASAGLCADPADTIEKRTAATKEYLRVVPPESMIKDLITEMMRAVPAEQKVVVEKSFKQAMDPNFISQLTLDAMPKHFTTKEIEALTKFYATPEGGAIMKKFGAYMADIMPAIQGRIISALQELPQP